MNVEAKIEETTMQDLPRELDHFQSLFDQAYLGVAIYQVLYPGEYPKNPQEMENPQSIPAILKDRKIQLIVCNQALVDQSGHSKEDLLTRDIYSLYTLLGASKGFENVNFQAIHHNEPRVIYCQWKRLDRKSNWIKCINTPLLNQQAQYVFKPLH